MSAGIRLDLIAAAARDTARATIGNTVEVILRRAVEEGRDPDPAAIEIAHTVGGADFVSRCLGLHMETRQ